MHKKYIIFLAIILFLLIAPISAENNVIIDNSTLHFPLILDFDAKILNFRHIQQI